MMSKNIENEIRTALEDITLDEMVKKMENVNPQDFKCQNEMARKRIERNVMNTAKKNIRKKNIGKKMYDYKKAAYTAAALAVLVGTTLTFGDKVRASLEKLFAFVPNQGVVEVEVDHTTDTAKQDMAKNSVYLLKNSTSKEMKNFAVSMENASVVNNKLKVLYKLDLTAVREATQEQFKQGFSAETMVKEFKAAGMEKYCEYNEDANPIVKSVKSSLNVDGTELQATSSNVMFSEASNYEAFVFEEYALDNMDVSNAKMELKIADVELPFTMVDAKSYETAEEALEGKCIATNVGITIMCDTKMQEDGWLYADFYVLDSGKFKAVDSIWPMFNEGEETGTDISSQYPYAMVNGKRIEGCGVIGSDFYNGKDGKPFRIGFNVGNDADLSALSLFLPNLMVIKEDTENENGEAEVIRIDNHFVFGADAVNEVEQSEDEIVEERTATEKPESFENPYPAEEVTPEQQAIFDKYKAKLENDGFTYFEYMSEDISFAREDGEYQYRTKLWAGDGEGHFDCTKYACIVLIGEDDYAWNEYMSYIEKYCTIEKTEYGLKAIHGDDVYEYYKEDKAWLESGKAMQSEE